MIRIEPGMVGYMKRTAGACHVIVTAPGQVEEAEAAVRAAVADMGRLPHPEERDDPATSFVSEPTIAGGRVSFWFDLADCESLMDDVVALLVARLQEHDVREAHIGHPPERHPDTPRFPPGPPPTGIRLTPRWSRDPAKGVSLLQLCAWLEGKPELSDRPDTVSKAIAIFVDGMSEVLAHHLDLLQTVWLLGDRLVGTASGEDEEGRRRWQLADWLVRTACPIYLSSVGLGQHGQRLGALSPLGPGVPISPVLEALLGAWTEVERRRRTIHDGRLLADLEPAYATGRGLDHAVSRAVGARRSPAAGFRYLLAFPENRRTIEGDRLAMVETYYGEVCATVGADIWRDMTIALYRVVEAVPSALILLTKFLEDDHQALIRSMSAPLAAVAVGPGPPAWDAFAPVLDANPDWRRLQQRLAEADPAMAAEALRAAGTVFVARCEGLDTVLAFTAMIDLASDVNETARLLCVIDWLRAGGASPEWIETPAYTRTTPPDLAAVLRRVAVSASITLDGLLAHG